MSVLDRLDVFDLGSEFKKCLAVNFKVLYERHRAVEDFFALCEVTVGDYTFSSVEKIVGLTFIV